MGKTPLHIKSARENGKKNKEKTKENKFTQVTSCSSRESTPTPKTSRESSPTPKKKYCDKKTQT